LLERFIGELYDKQHGFESHQVLFLATAEGEIPEPAEADSALRGIPIPT